MASRKLAEHNLTVEDVALADGHEDSWLDEDIHSTGRWSLENSSVGNILREFYFVKGYLRVERGCKRFALFGKAENVATAKYVWTVLHASFDRCWYMHKYLHNRPASERRLFVNGMVKGFTEKMRAERDLSTGKNTGLALISIDEKTTLAFEGAHPDARVKTSRFAKATGDPSTFHAGVKAGRDLKVNRAVGSNGRKAIS